LEFFGRDEIGVVQERGADTFRRRRETYRSEKRMRSRSDSGIAGRALIVPKRSSATRTARHRPNQLYIVGIGPGRLEQLTLRATEVL